MRDFTIRSSDVFGVYIRALRSDAGQIVQRQLKVRSDQMASADTPTCNQRVFQNGAEVPVRRCVRWTPRFP